MMPIDSPGSAPKTCNSDGPYSPARHARNLFCATTRQRDFPHRVVRGEKIQFPSLFIPDGGPPRIVVEGWMRLPSKLPRRSSVHGNNVGFTVGITLFKRNVAQPIAVGRPTGG